MYWPADIEWYEAEVLSSVQTTKRRGSRSTSTVYMIRYLIDDVVEKINIEEHLVRLSRRGGERKGGERKGGERKGGGGTMQVTVDEDGGEKEKKTKRKRKTVVRSNSGKVDQENLEKKEEEESKELTLRRLVFAGLARPGANRLVCLSSPFFSITPPSAPSSASTHKKETRTRRIRLLALLSDGRVQHEGRTFDNVFSFLNETREDGVEEEYDPWKCVRYRLPNDRSVSLGRLRQVGVELDQRERKRRRERMGNDAVQVGGDVRKSKRLSK